MLIWLADEPEREFKMANDNMKWVVLLVAAYLIFGQGGTTTTPPAPQPTGGAAAQCAYAPTVELLGVDKYDDSAQTDTTYKYKVNGDAVQTDSDGSFEAALGDSIEVLWGHNNASVFTPITKTYTINSCGLNKIHETGLLKNDTFTIQCFNEEGNLIANSGTTQENETIGAGETPTLKCELQGKSKRGLPLGGVMVLELNASQYKENDAAITGFGAASKTDVTGDPVAQALGVYSVSSVDNKAIAVEVEPFEGPAVKTFYVTLPAEDSVNPGHTNDPTLSLYAIGCYHEEDVTGGDLRCGIADLDNTFVSGKSGTETISVD